MTVRGSRWIWGWLFVILSYHAAVPASGADCPRDRKQYNLAAHLFRGGQYLLSAIHFSSVSLSDCDRHLADKSKFFFALATSELGEMETTLETLKSLAGSTQGEPAKLYLAYLDPSFAGDLAPAEKSRLDLWRYRTSPAEYRQTLSTTAITDSERSARLKMQELITLSPRRSPLVAGIASAVIPGLGQAYAGNWQSAGVALVLNALFLATTVEFAKRDMWGATAASALVFSVTYLGNIVNAVSGAESINQAARQPAERALKTSLFPEFQP